MEGLCFDKRDLINDEPQVQTIRENLSRLHDRLVMEEVVMIEHLGINFMRDNRIADPRDVTMIFRENPGWLPKFSHFEHTPFNDHGAGI